MAAGDAAGNRGGLIAVMGIFVADLAFRTPRLPIPGETVLGRQFRIGPGGKGSNQSVAAARLDGNVAFISKIGHDTFGRMARETFAAEGIDASHVRGTDAAETGAAAILVDDQGENAIVVVPGAAAHLTTDDITDAAPMVAGAKVFMTQLELPVDRVAEGLALARHHGVLTILNPAPAVPLPDDVLALVDCLTPNESEAEALSGVPVRSLADAERAADALLARGPGAVIMTLGAQGALVCRGGTKVHVPAVDAGPVVDTTGAGDAFNGGLAVALAEGKDLVEAAHFGCAVAGLSVTRPGTAPSMPRRHEVEAALRAVNS